MSTDELLLGQNSTFQRRLIAVRVLDRMVQCAPPRVELPCIPVGPNSCLVRKMAWS